jgi:hypothetical protein
MFGKTLWRLWIPLYFLLLALVVGGMVYARSRTLDLYGTPAAQHEWREWVEDTREQQGKGPVRRRTPQASRPPALILMKDYFAVCLAGASLLSTALYWTFALMLQGALVNRPTKRTIFLEAGPEQHNGR